MYGATPADRAMPPENAESDQTDPMRPGVEHAHSDQTDPVRPGVERTGSDEIDPMRPGVEHAEGTEEERSAPVAEDVSEGAPSTDQPGTTGKAAIVAGHSSDDSDRAAADGAQAERAQAQGTQAQGAQADPASVVSPSSTASWEHGFQSTPVFDNESAASFRQRWSEIQSGFIDDPRHAVEDADHFVADVVQAFTAGVESRRRALTTPWEQDGRTQTEDLRLAMREYRTLVDQILPG